VGVVEAAYAGVAGAVTASTGATASDRATATAMVVGAKVRACQILARVIPHAP
jgi:hypothetical protein